MPNFADIAVPLHSASQKGDHFRWTAECEEAFLGIKQKLMNAPILAFPRLDAPFIIDTDACDSGLGAGSGSGWERLCYSVYSTCSIKG